MFRVRLSCTQRCLISLTDDVEVYSETSSSSDHEAEEDIEVDVESDGDDVDLGYRSRLSLNVSISPITRDDSSVHYESSEEESQKTSGEAIFNSSASAFSRVTPMKSHESTGMLHSTPTVGPSREFLEKSYLQRRYQYSHSTDDHKHSTTTHRHKHSSSLDETPQTSSFSSGSTTSPPESLQSRSFPEEPPFLPLKFQRLNACLPFLDPRLSLTNRFLGLMKYSPFLSSQESEVPHQHQPRLSDAGREFMDLTFRKSAQLDDSAHTRSISSCSTTSSTKSHGDDLDGNDSSVTEEAQSSPEAKRRKTEDNNHETSHQRLTSLPHLQHPTILSHRQHHQQAAYMRYHNSRMMAPILSSASYYPALAQAQGLKQSAHHPHRVTSSGFVQLSPATGAHPNSSDATPGTRTLRDHLKPPALKKYKCDVCGKAFSRSNTLVTHKVRINS